MVFTYYKRFGPRDSSLIPSVYTLASTLSHDFPIAIRKGNHLTCNPYPIYNFVSYYQLSVTHYAFVISLAFVNIPKIIQE